MKMVWTQGIVHTIFMAILKLLLRNKPCILAPALYALPTEKKNVFPPLLVCTQEHSQNRSLECASQGSTGYVWHHCNKSHATVFQHVAPGKWTKFVS